MAAAPGTPPVTSPAPSPDTPAIEADDLKRKAVTRLGIAAIVTAAALAGLWWLDQDSAKKPTSQALEPQPVPIVPAGAEPALALASTDEPADESLSPEAEPEDQSGSDGGPDSSRPDSLPPPPRVSNSTPNITRIPASPPQLRSGLPPVPPSSAPTPSPTSPSPSTASGPLVLQLGVFQNPQRAQELVNRLQKQGIQARTETRVHIGPFLNRQEAEKAQAEMRKLGLSGVVTNSLIPSGK